MLHNEPFAKCNHVWGLAKNSSVIFNERNETALLTFGNWMSEWGKAAETFNLSKPNNSSEIEIQGKAE